MTKVWAFLVFIVYTIFASEAVAQNFRSEGKLQNTVRIPAGILKLLKETDEVKSCIESPEFDAGWFAAVKVNLNDDGLPDYLVKSELTCLYGPRAATWWVFRQRPKGFTQVFSDSALSLQIKRRKTGGYRDIETETTMVNIIRNTWKFNGRVYWLQDTNVIEPGK
jgi:hypothetical protein